MDQNVKEKVKESLESGRIKGFLGFKDKKDHIRLYLFCDNSDLNELVVGDCKRPKDSRYSLNKQLLNLSGFYPDIAFGVW